MGGWADDDCLLTRRRSTLKNPKVSDEAKQAAQERLDQMQ